jgi:hypothetical protein
MSMCFSVIYTVDVPKGESIQPHKARRRVMDRLAQTERTDSDGDYDYCGYPKHRKWWGELTKEQFLKFIEDTCLYAEDVRTMGALGFGGIQPAISFNGECQEAILNAYVTPFITDMKNPGTEKQWERIRRTIIDKFS